MSMACVERGDTQVSRVAKDLPKLPGTTISESFLRHRGDSWRNHLQRISPFLMAGEGVWWTAGDGRFHFRDGDEDSEAQDDDFNFSTSGIIWWQTWRSEEGSAGTGLWKREW